ncbi:hypothetical protein GXW77_08230, partial [Roseomonas alkaliterrae]
AVTAAERRRAELSGQIAAAEARLNERRGELSTVEQRLREARDASQPGAVTVIAPAQEAPPAPAPR